MAGGDVLPGSGSNNYSLFEGSMLHSQHATYQPDIASDLCRQQKLPVMPAPSNNDNNRVLL